MVSSTSSFSSATKLVLSPLSSCELELTAVFETSTKASLPSGLASTLRLRVDDDGFIVSGVWFPTKWYFLPIPEHSRSFLMHLAHRGVPWSHLMRRFVHWRQLSYRIAPLPAQYRPRKEKVSGSPLLFAEIRNRSGNKIGAYDKHLHDFGSRVRVQHGNNAT